MSRTRVDACTAFASVPLLSFSVRHHVFPPPTPRPLDHESVLAFLTTSITVRLPFPFPVYSNKTTQKTKETIKEQRRKQVLKRCGEAQQEKKKGTRTHRVVTYHRKHFDTPHHTLASTRRLRGGKRQPKLPLALAQENSCA